MRILHVPPGYWPVIGGIEGLVADLAKAQREDYGAHVAVMVPMKRNERSEVSEVDGTTVYSVDLSFVVGTDPATTTPVQRAKDLARFHSLIRRIIELERPDLIHIHSFSEVSLPVKQVARNLGIPVVFHLHGWVDPLLYPAFQSLIHETEIVLSVSESAAGVAREASGRTAPIRVVHNGVPDVVLSEVWSRSPRPTVAIVGRTTPQKGVDVALRAMKIVAEDHPDLLVNVVGGGDGLDDLQRLSAELGMTENVVFFGPQPREVCLEQMRAADLLLVPSRGLEGFPLVAVEAALLGVPVIATNVGGLPESIDDGVTGVLVDPEDVIALAEATKRLLASVELRNALGSAARERALREFSHQGFVATIMTAYGDALDSGR